MAKPQPNFDDEEEELDSFEDDEEMEEEGEKPMKITNLVPPKKQPIKPRYDQIPEPKRPQNTTAPVAMRAKEKEVSVSYSKYYTPEQVGIKNDATGEVVGEDIMGLLAFIINKLQKIEEATC
jgi:hypothetical protein